MVRWAGRWSSALVVAQVALSLTLVVAAGLFVQTFERLARAPLGFDRDRVMFVDDRARRRCRRPSGNLFYHRLVPRPRAVPGVAAAGGQLNPPIVGTLVGDIVVTEPGVAPPPDAEVVSQVQRHHARMARGLRHAAPSPAATSTIATPTRRRR